MLATRARLSGVPVEGFETVDEQLACFDVLTETDQQLLLLATLDELGRGRTELDATIADWLAGRTESLAARINREFEGSPMLKRMLLDDRNVRFAADIARRMEAPGTLFVAVGAGHLAGPRSLLEELARHGLVAERVAAPASARRSRR